MLPEFISELTIDEIRLWCKEQKYKFLSSGSRSVVLDCGDDKVLKIAVNEDCAQEAVKVFMANPKIEQFPYVFEYVENKHGFWMTVMEKLHHVDADSDLGSTLWGASHPFDLLNCGEEAVYIIERAMIGKRWGWDIHSLNIMVKAGEPNIPVYIDPVYDDTVNSDGGTHNSLLVPTETPRVSCDYGCNAEDFFGPTNEAQAA